MATPVYPSLVKGLTYTVLKVPEFRTLKQEASNGYTLRMPQIKNPLWHFSLIYDYLYDTYLSPNNTQAYGPTTDLQTLMGFFIQMRGQGGDFLFQNSLDGNDSYA